MFLIRNTFITICACALSIPAYAAFQKGPPSYGTIIMSVEDHFALSDDNHSGTLSPAEYATISADLKNQSKSEALADFAAMDMNNDQKLTLEEFYGEMPSALTL